MPPQIVPARNNDFVNAYMVECNRAKASTAGTAKAKVVMHGYYGYWMRYHYFKTLIQLVKLQENF